MRNEAKTTANSPTALLDPAPPRPFRARPAIWLAMIGISTAVCALAIMVGTHKFHLGPAAIVLMPILWTVLIEDSLVSRNGGQSAGGHGPCPPT